MDDRSYTQELRSTALMYQQGGLSDIERVPNDIWTLLFVDLNLNDYNSLVRSSKQLMFTLQRNDDIWYCFAIRYFPFVLSEDLNDRSILRHRFKSSILKKQGKLDAPEPIRACCKLEHIICFLAPCSVCCSVGVGTGFLVYLPTFCSTHTCAATAISGAVGTISGGAGFVAAYVGLPRLVARWQSHRQSEEALTERTRLLSGRNPSFFREGYRICVYPSVNSRAGYLLPGVSWQTITSEAEREVVTDHDISKFLVHRKPNNVLHVVWVGDQWCVLANYADHEVQFVPCHRELDQLFSTPMITYAQLQGAIQQLVTLIKSHDCGQVPLLDEVEADCLRLNYPMQRVMK